LEQHEGRPAEEGSIPFADVAEIRNGSVVELVMKDKSKAIPLDFLDPSKREAWGKFLELASKVLSSEEEHSTLLGRSRR
jgi:hypothetical protein